MYDNDIESNCWSENLIYRLYKKFLKGATKEEALDEILREDSKNDTESTQNNTDE